MKNTSKILIGAALCVLLAACAGMGEREQPGWVTGISDKYPEQGWLTGHGQADSRVQAENRARAEIARVFAVRVQAQSHDEQRYSAINGTGQNGQAGGQTRSESEISRQIDTSTDEVLRGVQIADYWQDPQTLTWHALAVLSRTRASMSLRQQIASLDDATRGFLQSAAPGDEAVFQKLALLGQAITLQQARAELNQRLQAVGATGQGVPAIWSVGELRAKRQVLLGSIRIAPRGQGEHADSLRAMLGAALSRAGLDVEPQAPYQMVAMLNYSALPPRDNWHWVRGVLQVEVTDNQGISYGVRRWEIKQSATDAATAERRFVSEVARILDEQAVSTLVEFATPSE